MAKYKSQLSFSIELLKANRKHHKTSLKTGKVSPYAEKYMDKKMLAGLKKRQADHQRYYDDCSRAIAILENVSRINKMNKIKK